MMIHKIFKAALMTTVLAGGVMLSGCGGDERTGPGDVSQGEVPAGQAVTVTGEIERRYDDRTFTLSGENELLKPDLVVVSRTPLPATATEDSQLRVVGTVRKIGIVEVERELGWDFQPEVEVELEEIESYLVADSVEVIPPGS